MKNRMIEIILTLSGIFVACNIYTLLPIYHQIAASINIPISTVISASSIFTLCYAIGLLFFGPLSDQLGRKKIIVFGMGLSTITTALVGFSDTSFSLMLFRGLQGFSLGSFAPVAFAYCYDVFSGQKRTLILSIINTGFLIAGIFGQIISAFITASFNWNWTFFLFTIIYLLLFVLSIYFLPFSPTETEFKNNQTMKIMFFLLKRPLFLLCYGIVLTLLFMFVGFYNLLNHHFNGYGDSLIWIRCIGLFGAILSLFTGKIMERLGSYNTLLIGIGIGLLSLSPLFFSHSTFFLLFTSILFVAAISLLIPTIISIIASIGGIHRAKAMSLYSFFLLIGASIAPIIFARLPFITGISILFLSLFIDGLLAVTVKKVSVRSSAIPPIFQKSY